MTIKYFQLIISKPVKSWTSDNTRDNMDTGDDDLVI